jgi:hypothetical protein
MPPSEDVSDLRAELPTEPAPARQNRGGRSRVGAGGGDVGGEGRHVRGSIGNRFGECKRFDSRSTTDVCDNTH